MGHELAVSSPQGRFEAGAALLNGRPMLSAEAHGKQLLLGFADQGAIDDPAAASPTAWLRVHLGIYGAWTFASDGSRDVVAAIGAPRRRVGERESTPVDEHFGHGGAWMPPAPRGAVRVRIAGRHAVADLTGPTACEILTPEEKAALEARLGPDPLRPDAVAAAFIAAVRRSRVPVGQLLMNQHVIAGVGNIYRAEVLFRAALDPLRPGRDVPAATLEGVWTDLVDLMADGAAIGSIVTTRHEHRAHGPFYVYRRAAQPCLVCGSPVLLKEVAARKLYWCGACQA